MKLWKMKLNLNPGVVSNHLRVSAHIYRQILGTTAASLMSFSQGIVFGYPPILFPQLKCDKNFVYDESSSSWMVSSVPLAMMIACPFSSGLSDYLGRKKGQMLLALLYILGWVVIGFARNNAVFLVGTFILGICIGSSKSFGLVYIGEIVDPTYRSIALYTATLAIYLGYLFCYTIGKYAHWNTSCFLFTIPNIISFIILLFLKESPLWLLVKGKIDEGKDSFLSFRGISESSDKELKLVITKCDEKITITFRDILKLLFKKASMKSFLVITLMFVVVQWGGVNIIPFYADNIFEKTFPADVDTFLLLVAICCIRLTGGLINCLFGKNVSRKLTFTISCFVSGAALLGLVIYLYLCPRLVWLGIACLVIYFLATSALLSISWAYVVELFPSEIRGFSMGVSSEICFTLLFISVRVTPGIMANYGVIIIYAVFAVITLVSGACLYFMLPDTNGKSLQEIENTLYKTKAGDESNI